MDGNYVMALWVIARAASGDLAECSSEFIRLVRSVPSAARSTCAPYLPRARDLPVCGAPVKTATISFGQAMPEDEMRRATELARQCDLFLAIGSSLVVWPAAGFPLMAKNCGAKLVIINNEPTEQDDVADLVIRFDIGETLGPFVGN